MSRLPGAWLAAFFRKHEAVSSISRGTGTSTPLAWGHGSTSCSRLIVVLHRPRFRAFVSLYSSLLTRSAYLFELRCAVLRRLEADYLGVARNLREGRCALYTKKDRECSSFCSSQAPRLNAH